MKMKRLMLLSLLGMVLSSPVAHAAEKSRESQSFWALLRNKIEALVPQKKVVATNATGGVRGAAVSADDVYWKGEANVQSVAEEELDEFKNAMALAETNDLAQAQAAFTAFVQKYPASPLRRDAEQALSLFRQ